MKLKNQRWVLASYPDGMPVEENWRLEDASVPQPRENEVLARALYLSVDPYMRGRISPQRGYAKGVEIGELMVGGAVAEVVHSNHPDWNAGDILETMKFGWQEYAIVNPEEATRVLPELGPIHAWLSYLGMPGITAWCALETIGAPQIGETVLISAAAGAVGQVAGQLAKASGSRAVAVASSAAKLDWCNEIGYDEGINYRESEDLTRDFAKACPNGIDVYFDNTAGPIHDAAMKNLALGARIIVVGTISLADRFNKPDIGERFLRQILIARAKVQGFLVFDHLHRYDRARKALADHVADGRLKFRTDFMDGIESMPTAFLQLLKSANFGKQLVRTKYANSFEE